MTVTEPRRVQINRPPITPDELWWFCKATWGVTIPRLKVCEDHVSPFDAFCEGYFGNRSNWVLLVGSCFMGAVDLKVASCQALVTSARWASKVQPDGECIRWIGSLKPAGYGQVYLDGSPRYAHRIAWIAAHGVNPDSEMELDHICHNRWCVNAEHLVLGTHARNMANSKTSFAVTGECRRGHLYSQDNLLYTTKGRTCRECNRLRSSATNARIRAAKQVAA